MVQKGAEAGAGAREGEGEVAEEAVGTADEAEAGADSGQEVENAAADKDEAEAAATGCVCRDADCLGAVVSLCFLFVCENSRTAVVGERRRLAAAAWGCGGGAAAAGSPLVCISQRLGQASAVRWRENALAVVLAARWCVFVRASIRVLHDHIQQRRRISANLRASEVSEGRRVSAHSPLSIGI